MAVVYELALNDQTKKVVEVDDSLHVGDAVILDDEIWLVLRESELAALRGRARFECRRALHLQDQARNLIEYAHELQLQFTHARELPATA